MDNKDKLNPGDFVLAKKMHGFDSPHWEWIAGIDYEKEYAIITGVIEADYRGKQYYVKYIDGSEDICTLAEITLLAPVSGKNSRDDAALPLIEEDDNE